jgi:hypothetical protein
MIRGRGGGLGAIGEHGGVSSGNAPPNQPDGSGSDELRPTGRPNARLRQTVRDMVISLVVVLAVIGVIMAITWRPAPDPVRAIDPAPTLELARSQADYPVVYPADLDPQWRPTSARWEATPDSIPLPAWQVGFVTPQGDYAQVGQTATDNPAFIAGQVGNARPTGEWAAWQTYEGVEQRALVSVEDGVTIVVSGTAPWETLQMLAERLSGSAVPTPVESPGPS